MASEWYIQGNDGKVEGPLMPSALKHLAEKGALKPESLVRKGTDGKWVRASGVKGIFPEPPAHGTPPERLSPPQLDSDEIPEYEWYIRHDDGRVEGALPSEVLKDKAAKGNLTSHTLIRKGADGAWVRAGTVEQFFPAWASVAVDLDELEASRATPETVTTSSSRLRLCPDCACSISHSALSCPKCGCPLPGPRISSRYRYPALRIIAATYKVFAILIPLIIVLVLSAAGPSDLPNKEQIIIPLIVSIVLSPLFLWGTAELILLLIDIENNTRRPLQ